MGRFGELKDSPSNAIPGFNERLMSWMPTMIEHRCSIGERGGFFQRLRMGTYLAHILEHVTLELQTLAGTEVGFGKARETSEEGVYRVVFEYVEENLGRECLKAARELVPGRRLRPAVRRARRNRAAPRSGPASLPRPQHQRDRRGRARPAAFPSAG